MVNQRGEGRLGVLVWIVLMGAGIFFAVRTIPVKISTMEFNESVDKQVQFAATTGTFNQEKLMKSILDKATEMEIPLTKKQVQIEPRSGELRVTVQYQIEIDLAVYKWVWDYDLAFEHMRM